MSYFYSAEKNAFYVESLKERYADDWPDDALELPEDEWKLYAGPPPDGKMRGVGPAGMPVWVDAPEVPDEKQATELEA